MGSQILLDGYLILTILSLYISLAFLTWAFSLGDTTWKNARNRAGSIAIPGPRGLPCFGSLLTLSRGLVHRSLASTASALNATGLMAFSLGQTPAVVASDPHTAKEILTYPLFADRPIGFAPKQSARSLMFARAIGFAPNGASSAASHLFCPRRIIAHEPGRRRDYAAMIRSISDAQCTNGPISIRKHLQAAALNNITGNVFGRRYDHEMDEIQEMVREGFELLGAFNWSDYLPWLSHFYDPRRIAARCEALVPRVRKFVVGELRKKRK